MRSLPQGEPLIGSRPQNRADSPDASGSILLARAASAFRSAFLLWYPKSLPSLGAWDNRLRGVFVATDYPLGQDRASPGLVRHASYVGRGEPSVKRKCRKTWSCSPKQPHALRLALEAAGIK